VDDVRPRFQYYNRGERNDFNLSAKRTFKLFLNTNKENENEAMTPPTNKRMKASPNKKNRVSDEKLESLIYSKRCKFKFLGRNNQVCDWRGKNYTNR
jgi:hypothetical protein